MNAPARLAQVAPARAADTPYATDGWWSLAYQGWTLLTPHGARIGLTALERTCLLCLAGNPARVVRSVAEDQIGWRNDGDGEYQRLARRSLAALVECEPLTAPEPDRLRNAGGARPVRIRKTS